MIVVLEQRKDRVETPFNKGYWSIALKLCSAPVVKLSQLKFV